MKYSLMQLKQSSTPTEFSHHLKEMGDVFWWQKGNFWVITDYNCTKQILLSDDYSCDRSSFFLSRMPEMNLSLVEDFFKVVSKMMVMSDAPAHTGRRRICYQGFGTHSIDKLKPLIQKTIDTALDKLDEVGTLDFVSEMAQKIPSVTLAEFFAIPESERMDFYHWSNNMTQFFGGSTTYHDEDGIKVNDSAKALQQYFSDLILIRRQNPGDDFLSVLLSNQAHFQLSDEEIISQAVMMLVAGQVTTSDQMCNNLYTLLSDNNAKEMTIHNSESLNAVIEECNRLDPAVTFIFRVVENETVLADKTFKPGDVIFISTHAVNRDKNIFPNPDSIDIKHNKAAHYSYGYGSHFCLGAKLARQEMQQCFQSLFKRFPTIGFDKTRPAQRKHHSLSFSGFETLNITL